MKKEFVLYELAVKLKTLGFDEPCFAYYIVNEVHAKGYAFCYFNIPKRLKDDWDVLAPTFSQAFRWFREKYGICTSIRRGSIKMHEHMKKSGFLVKDYEWSLDTVDGNHLTSMAVEDTWEDAELACLNKLIEIVESKSE